MASYDFDALAPEELTSGSTSYFADPDDGLDPSLFDGTHLKPTVRMFVLHTVHDFLREHFVSSETWCRVWIAGSGVSYQWSAAREPGDLDVLLGINYVEFRQGNPSYSGYSDTEIAKMINEVCHDELYPEVANVALGRGTYEVTVYVNAGVTAAVNGINFINPYAAYDCTEDEWAKVPQKNPHVHIHPSWQMAVEADRARGERIVNTYGDVLRQIRGAQNPAHRTNAENNLNVVLGAASGLFDEIHAGRKAAFGPSGHGYSDFANYRWQSGKANGVVHSMRRLKDYADSARDREDFETYGMELPDTETLIRRASNPRSVY
jgi:hypothetical protein